MRGKPIVIFLSKVLLRITPAGAGKTAADTYRLPRREDHPRRCGENPKILVQSIGIPGSPPQVRGKLKSLARKGYLKRITPAGAGKTINFAFVSAAKWDHPRRCGENTAIVASMPISMGSPPQVRGKPEGISKYGDYGRITPAGAGKTQVGSGKDCAAGDHPRRCGENFSSLRGWAKQSGSPPQVRGKPGICRIFLRGWGITPAGAGKTSRALACRLRARGSPPQVRGKLTIICSDVNSSGITPAGAGKTCHHLIGINQSQDHPRRCGENATDTTHTAVSAGSPPQVRGKHRA